MTIPYDPDNILTGWQSHHGDLFGRHILKVPHSLHTSRLFSRESLAKLIETCPEEHLGMESFRVINGEQVSLQGRLGEASGAAAIAAIEQGNVWMNIRRIMEWNDEYNAFLQDVFAQLEAKVPGLKTSRRTLGILISSPGTQVFYHCDIQGQLLWQISGTKRVYLYPAQFPFYRGESIENIMLRDTAEEIEHKPWFDDHARSVELHPGDMLTWPLYAPHRVENGNMLNVSLTMEYWTTETRNAYAVHYGNGVLRRTLGNWNYNSRPGGLHVYPKAALTLLWKKMGMQPEGEVTRTKHFEIDSNVPLGIHDLQP